MTRILEVALTGAASSWLADYACSQGVSEAEIVRRALQFYRDPAVWAGDAQGSNQECEGGWKTSSEEPRSFGRRALPPAMEMEAPAEAEVTVLSNSPAPCRRQLPPPAPPLETQVSLFPLARSPQGSPAEAPPFPSPVLLTPCIPAKKGGQREWPLSQTQLAAWEELFFDMDVLAVLRVAQGWLLSNHLKTYSGMKRFFYGWLVRAQNRGRYAKRSAVRQVSKRPTLKEVYGFESWDAWEAKLRGCLTPEELEQDLESLAELRAAWENRYGVG